MITLDKLLAIMPQLPRAKAEAYLPYLSAAMKEFAITTPARQAAFLAQLAHESVQLRYMEEIASGEDYEGRTDLGNTQPGDGRRYKGRGPIQLTGRANYRKYGNLLGLDLEENPYQAASPEVGFRIAGAYWYTHGLNQVADQNTLEAFKLITRRINGGYNGLADRLAYWERAKKVLARSEAGVTRHKGFGHDGKVTLVVNSRPVQDGYLAMQVRGGRLTAAKLSGPGGDTLALDPSTVEAFEWDVKLGESKPTVPERVLLDVPFYGQRDSATWQGDRMCRSSSLAMAVKFMKPEALSNSPNADDEYLSILNGDTTQTEPHRRLLANLGVPLEFRQDLTWEDVDRQLEAGYPVVFGWIHRGHVSAPSGNGHYSVFVGRTADGSGYYVHDPFGEPDLVAGTHDTSKSGKALIFSRKNLEPRFFYQGSLGWGYVVKRP